MNKKKKYSYLRGIIAPVVTPFTEDEKLDEKRFREQVRYILDAGVHGISPGGSTGEGSALRDNERNRMIEIIQEENTKKVPVVAGIIRHSTRDAIKAALDAKASGADALMITPIQYLGGTDAEGNYRYYKAISDEVELPIIIYNVIPQNTISPKSCLKMLKEIEFVVGIKQSCGSVSGFAQVNDLCHDYGLIYSATDELLLTTFELGADGAIAAILGLFPEECVKMWNLYHDGKLKEAAELQTMLYRIWMSITGSQFPRRLKAALECLGRGCGNALAPLSRASDEEFEQIREAIQPYIKYKQDYTNDR